MTLTDHKEIFIRFSEVDSMRIVWHGNYIKYFEDGRESFGRKYGLGYLDVYAQGVMTPIVKIGCEYKRPVEYGDTAIVETRYVPSEAAKLVFEYTIYRKKDMEVAATGTSTQVFLTPQGELLLMAPEFFNAWKNRWGV